MSVRFTTLRTWKKFVVAIVFVSVVALFVFIIQSEKWKFVQTYHHIIKFSLFKTNITDINVNVFKSVQIKRQSDQAIIRRNPYITDSVCQNFSLSLHKDDTYTITGLVSFPGSGNTWTRHLIQLATGVYTGSYYFDMDLFARGFLGEREAWYSGRTIVQKFHDKYDKRMNINRAIILVREPFPAILSFANYLEAGHTGRAYNLPYHHKDWPNFLLKSAYNWLALAKSWIESPATLLVIHYEHLRLNPVENLRKICKFLDHSCPYLHSPCFKAKMEGSFHRLNTLSEEKVRKDEARKAKYPSGVKDIISRGIDHLNTLLTLHGHEPIPLNLYQYYVAENKISRAFS